MPHPRRATFPKPTRSNTVGTQSAARKTHRLHREAAQRETHRDVIGAHAANLRSKADAAPLTAWRQWWRHYDYTAGPTWALGYLVAVLALAVLDLVLPLGLLTAVAYFLPLWASMALITLAVGYWEWTDSHKRRARERWLEDDSAPERGLFVPSFAAVDIETPTLPGDDKPHRRTVYGRIPPGYSVEQYARQQDVARDTFGHPVTIRLARPGIVAITQLYRDLLAEPVPWRDIDPDTIDLRALWLGIDRDARDITLPIVNDGGGLAALLAGAPGSGKTATANAILAQYCSLPPTHRRLWIVDPADGVDLGCWHPLAYRLADNPLAGLALMRSLLADMIHRRQAMRLAGIDCCRDPSEEFPHQFLVMDEIPELTLNEDKKVAAEACLLLARIRRVGRKTGTSIFAITQDQSRDVVPTSISKIFSHRICFKVSNYRETDMILPGARAQGWHPEQFDPAHPGRFVLWNLSTYVEGRGPGLYGAARHAVVKRLTDLPPPSSPPVQAPFAIRANGSTNGVRPNGPRALPVSTVTPIDTVEIVRPSAGEPGEVSPTPSKNGSGRSIVAVRPLVFDRLKAAGRRGLTTADLCEELGEPDWLIRRALNTLTHPAVKRGGRWIDPEAA